MWGENIKQAGHLTAENQWRDNTGFRHQTQKFDIVTNPGLRASMGERGLQT